MEGKLTFLEQVDYPDLSGDSIPLEEDPRRSPGKNRGSLGLYEVCQFFRETGRNSLAGSRAHWGSTV
jgi:hypothetical protein